MITDKIAITKILELASEISELARAAGADWSMSLMLDDDTPTALRGLAVADAQHSIDLFGAEVDLGSIRH